MNLLVFVLSFSFMEFVAYTNHKYIMHGFLWKWHKDHHVNDHKKLKNGDEIVEKRFELNDLFFIVYATPAIVSLLIGYTINSHLMISIGLGISLYGFIYFIIHDVIIHKRLKIPFLQNSNNFYIKAILKAHDAHHHGKNKKDFSNYGLLIFQLRFLKKY